VAEVVSERGFEWYVFPIGMFGDHGHIFVLRVVFEVCVETIGPAWIHHEQQP
jgi:hypothetical protein